ncbi:unnamed protein product, partial [Polarella glacialis]
MFHQYGFNLKLSNDMGLLRTVPDLRNDACKARVSPPSEQMPKASVIIIFYNEPLSSLLRNVMGVLNRSPAELLGEVLLVDDHSSLEELSHLPEHLERLQQQLPPGKIRLVRRETHDGIVGARNRGAKEALYPIIVILDSHAEVTHGWLEPLVSRIHGDRTRVIVPNIVPIHIDTLAIEGGNTWPPLRGVFNWRLTFLIFMADPQVDLIELKELDALGLDKKSSAIKTPVMPGGLFAMDREYFFELGGYDPDIRYYGAEHVEMSFRVWMCGGSMEIAPCSHIGHIYREFDRFGVDKQLGGINIGAVLDANDARVAEVWMDDYQELFYKYRSVSDKAFPNLQDRHDLRKKLKCKSFDWFLKTVVRDLYVPELHALPGRLSTPGLKRCVDNSGQEAGPLHLQSCTRQESQKLEFTSAGYLQFAKHLEHMLRCIRTQTMSLVSCDQAPSWDLREGGEIVSQTRPNMCLDRGAAGSEQLDLQQCSGSARQTWNFKGSGTLAGPDFDNCVDNMQRTSGPAGLYVCHGGDTQQWKLDDDAKLRSASNDGACLGFIASIGIAPCTVEDVNFVWLKDQVLATDGGERLWRFRPSSSPTDCLEQHSDGKTLALSPCHDAGHERTTQQWSDFAKILLTHDYAAVKKIGEGSFGVTVLVEDKEGKKAVCKLVDVSRASSKETQEARREGRLLAQLKHPYIVRYRENFAERGWLGIVMEFCDGGDVTAQLEKCVKSRTRLPEQTIMRWFTQAMLALKYLHEKHILHRDLKPQNLFLTQANDLKVGDFGISKVMSCTAAFARSFVGTPYYLCPEVFQDKPYAWPADIWSMGCILYQLCALKVPFDAANIKELGKKITSAKIPTVPSEYSEGVREVCSDMMRRDPVKRPTADGVIRHAAVQVGVRALLGEAKCADKDEEKEDKEATKVRREVFEQFQQFDRNGDGVIDLHELSDVLRHLDAGVWTEERIDQVLKLADTNGDGRIQLEEFVHWMFGGVSDSSDLAKRLQETVQLANKALEDENLPSFCETLIGLRQAVDLGCLRVSPPEASVKCCDSLAWLALGSRDLLEQASDSDLAFSAAQQMRAILLAVEQLLVDSRRRRLRRVGGVATRTAVKGVCFELADGGRMGRVIGGRLSDTDLSLLGARWQVLQEGESVLRIHGSSATPSAPSRAPSAERRPSKRVAGAPPRSRDGSRPPSPMPAEAVLPLCSGFVLSTNLGRQLEFGSRLAAGSKPSFSFEATDGEEIVEALFDAGSCTGVRRLPVAVSWSAEKVAELQTSFRSAAENVWSTLLLLSRRQGIQQGRFALLQAHQLGLPVDTPEDSAPDRAPPDHWDLTAMGGTGLGAVKVQARDSEKPRLQALINLAYHRTTARDPPSAQVPYGLELVEAFRLQNSRSWAAYVGRREAVLKEMLSAEDSGKMLADPTISAQMESIGATLDGEANCAWLFHGISAAAAQDASSTLFDISVADSEERGGLYGRGIYFTEHCDKVDKLIG